MKIKGNMINIKIPRQCENVSLKFAYFPPMIRKIFFIATLLCYKSCQVFWNIVSC